MKCFCLLFSPKNLKIRKFEVRVEKIEKNKEINEKDLSIKRTLDRKKIWIAFTPQIFRKEILIDATLNKAFQGKVFTDEASLVEANNGKLRMIQGSKDNLKITFPDDINLAKSILISQGRMEKLL